MPARRLPRVLAVLVAVAAATGQPAHAALVPRVTPDSAPQAAVRHPSTHARGPARGAAHRRPATASPAPAPNATPAPKATDAPHSSAAGPPPGPAPSPASRGVASPSTPADVAQRQADLAATRVRSLTAQYRARAAATDQAAGQLAAAFSIAEQARAEQQAADLALHAQRADQSRRIRTLYAEGPDGLGLALLTAQSPQDALWQVSTAPRIARTLLDHSRDEVALAQQLAGDSAARARATQDAEQQLSTALGRMQDAAAGAQQLLSAATDTLTRLSAAARALRSAQDAAAALAAAQAAAAAQSARLAGAVGPVRALSMPPDFEHAYRRAAGTCPGLRWTLLAAIGQVESGHGRNEGPSSAGAIGPMQFLPSTFAEYAVDGDGDGVTDPWDVADAVPTAARYLCASGAAGGTPASVQAALFTYNHAQWYVDLVLATERAIQATTR